MSWLSSLTSAIFGSTSAADSDESNPTLLVIEGALFLDRPDAIRGVHECLFTDATLAIRRTDTPFTFHLVVTRTIDEDDAVSADSENDDDAPDLDDDLLLGNEKIFIVSPSMKFHTGLMVPDNLATLRWCEVDGAPDEIYEFVVAGGTSSPMFQMMRQTILQCIYQRVYMRSAEGASAADLESLVYVPEGEKAKRVNKGKAKVDNDKTPVRPAAVATTQRQQQARQATTPTPKSKSTPTQQAQQQSPTRHARTPSPTPPAPSSVNLAKLLPKPVPFPGGSDANMDLTLELDAELFMFLASRDQFQLVTDKCTVQLLTNASDSTDAWLAVESDRGVLVRQPLTHNMNHMFWPDQCAMIWNMYFKEANGKDGCVSVSVNLATEAEFREWRRAFTQLHVQATLEASLASMQLDDKDMEYLEQQTSTDRGMGRDHADDEDDEERRRSSDEESNEEDDDQVDDDGPAGGAGNSDDDDEHAEVSDDDDPTATNSLLTTTRSRTYVVRGGSIGVFGYGPRGKVKFETMIKKVKFNRDPLKPTKVLLHDGERKMILSDADKDPTKLYELDLGSEKVVREFSLPGRPVNDLSAAAKSTESAAGAEATFLGVSDRSVFRVDPRMAGSVVADDSQYTYSKNVGLKAVAASSSGQVAVASAKGELRLFNQVGKRATTALQSAGDAIVHLDVSIDGNYVLATTRTHLLLFDVRHTTAKGNETTAFSTRMPKDGRPNAARLGLLPVDVAKMGMPPCFTAAYFNVSVTGESSLVTSTGPYVITWSLDDVVRGRKDKYVIKRYDEEVVADQFRFGDDQQIVLALPNDVQSVSRRRMGRL